MTKKFLLVVMGAFFLGAAITYISGDYESLSSNLWNLIPPFAAAVFGILTVKIYGMTNSHAKSLAFMALGVFFWFLGDFIWFVLEYFLNKNPFPSIADYFYFTAYPLLLIGLILEVKSNVIKWTYRKAIIVGILSFLLGFIVFYFGVIQAYDPQENLVNNIVAMTYGIGDLILIIFTAIIFMVAIGYQKGKLFLPWLSILIGFSLILVSDIMFAVFRGDYENFTSIRNIDLGWISGFLLIGYGFFSIGNALKEVRKKLVGRI